MATMMGCAGTLPPTPGKGGPAWFELSSEHFTMWTDAEPTRARALVRDLEDLRQVIVGVAFPGISSAGRMLAIALSDDDELRALTSTGEARAFAMYAQTPLWQPAIVVSAFSNGMREDETLTHELTHAVSGCVIHRQPRWLAEGMAKYFETLQASSDRTIVEVGVAPQDQRGPRRIAHLVPVSTLFAWQGAKQMNVERRLYSTAWALFTFLINAHRDELLRYLQLLDALTGPPDESPQDRSARLWNDAFPSLPLNAVDAVLQQWLISGHHVVLHFNVQRREWPITERRLEDADVHALRGFLFAKAARTAESRDSIRAALALDSNNVLARLIGVTYHKMMLSARGGRAIAGAHPGDWRAWWLAAIALHDAEGETAEEVADEVKACELIAQNPAVVAPPKLCPGHRAASTSP